MPSSQIGARPAADLFYTILWSGRIVEIIMVIELCLLHVDIKNRLCGIAWKWRS